MLTVSGFDSRHDAPNATDHKTYFSATISLSSTTSPATLKYNLKYMMSLNGPLFQLRAAAEIAPESSPFVLLLLCGCRCGSGFDQLQFSIGGDAVLDFRLVLLVFGGRRRGRSFIQ
jgi:hypothetical protein